MLNLSKTFRALLPGSVLLLWTGLMPVSALSDAAILLPDEFEQIAAEGFGDRSNTYTWSSRWWNDKLYIGTARSLVCVQNATIARWKPNWNWRNFLYPGDPRYGCTPLPQDLPLRAELWRWSPEIETWDLVFQSPEDVSIPGHPGKLVARDIGFRTMALFTEVDGTEALYVGGVSSESFNPGVPLARLLRSEDGTTFAPVPQDPGTFLGEMKLVDDLPFNGFRSLQSFAGRLFGIASWGYAGHGSLIASADPKEGNDSFFFAAPMEEAFYQLAEYNGALYAGTASESGFKVVKTNGSGQPPYRFTTIIPAGGYLQSKPSQAVVSLFEFNGRLYVGTDRPAEIYRINPDDSWELIAGEPRQTPAGMMRPLSGLGAGFDNPDNFHIWRMQDAWGTLYTSTFDQTTKWEEFSPFSSKRVKSSVAGFDLFGTRDGYFYTMVTRTGLIDQFDSGGRQFAFSPIHGLVLGSSNDTGANVWRAKHPSPDRLRAPEQLEAYGYPEAILLSWKPTPGASSYHVYRSNLSASDKAFDYIGETTNWFFNDDSADRPQAQTVAHYFVVAEDQYGEVSGPSNTARVPVLSEPITFDLILTRLRGWSAGRGLLTDLTSARYLFERRSYDASTRRLKAMQQSLRTTPELLAPAWRADDAIAELSKLIRRVELTSVGAVN